MKFLHPNLCPLSLLLILCAAFPHWLQPTPRSLPPSYNIYARQSAHYTYAGIGPRPTVALPSPTPTTKSPRCNHDNCLRQFLRNSSNGTEFCAAFAASNALQPTSLPTSVAAACKDDVVRVLSACSCLNGILPTSTSRIGPTVTGNDFTTSTSVSVTGSRNGTDTSTKKLPASSQVINATSSLHYTLSSATSTGIPCLSLVETSFAASTSPTTIIFITSTSIKPISASSGLLSDHVTSSASIKPPYPIYNATSLIATGTGMGTAISEVSTTTSSASSNVMYPPYSTDTSTIASLLPIAYETASLSLSSIPKTEVITSKSPLSSTSHGSLNSTTTTSTTSTPSTEVVVFHKACETSTLTTVVEVTRTIMNGYLVPTVTDYAYDNGYESGIGSKIEVPGAALGGKKKGSAAY